jgi:hypothetical protein
VGKKRARSGDSYPERWAPADPEDCDDDGEDYCPTCQAQGAAMSLFSILIILIIVALLFGGYGSTRDGWGYYGWGPLGLILVIFIVLALTGALR